MVLENYPLLELPVKNNEQKITAQLINVGNNSFMFKNKDAINVFFKQCEKWLQNYNSLSEKDYEKLIGIRKGTILELSDSLSLFDNQIDSLVITLHNQSYSNESILKEICENFDKKIQKLFVNPAENQPESLTFNSPNKFSDNLFISSRKNVLKWSIEQKKIVKSYKDISSLDIFSLKLASNKTELYLGCTKGE